MRLVVTATSCSKCRHDGELLLFVRSRTLVGRPTRSAPLQQLRRPCLPATGSCLCAGLSRLRGRADWAWRPAASRPCGLGVASGPARYGGSHRCRAGYVRDCLSNRSFGRPVQMLSRRPKASPPTHSLRSWRGWLAVQYTPPAAHDGQKAVAATPPRREQSVGWHRRPRQSPTRFGTVADHSEYRPLHGHYPRR
jgi:hypothetical protein